MIFTRPVPRSNDDRFPKDLETSCETGFETWSHLSLTTHFWIILCVWRCLWGQAHIKTCAHLLVRGLTCVLGSKLKANQARTIHASPSRATHPSNHTPANTLKYLDKPYKIFNAKETLASPASPPFASLYKYQVTKQESEDEVVVSVKFACS